MNIRIRKVCSTTLCQWTLWAWLSAACVFVGLALAPVAPAFGQSMVAGERVGRVAGVVGAAQLWDAQERRWTPLVINHPLSAGDRIRSEREARVEVQVGSLELFLGPQTDAEWIQLDEQAAQLRLNQGHLVARVRTMQWARTLQLVTDELVAQPMTVGQYRLDRDTVSGGRSAAASLQGQLSLSGAEARMEVAPGQRIEVLGRGSGAGVRSTLLLNDAFAGWVAARDAASASPSVVATGAPEITGLDVLDQHGRWESHPEMGLVWYPVNVRPGWEPFREGRWVWVRPWGWTWVDDAPWGFAPSNYGRWVQWNSRWVWWPGHGHVRGRPAPGRPPVPGHGVGGASIGMPHDRHGDDWRRDGEHRSVRTPRVDGGGLPGSLRPLAPQGATPGPLPPGAVSPAPPAGVAAPAMPAGPATHLMPSASPPGSAIAPMPGRDTNTRLGPERRHGFERPTERLDSPTRIDRSQAPVRSDRNDRPDRREPVERQDRQRQLAQ